MLKENKSVTIYLTQYERFALFAKLAKAMKSHSNIVAKLSKL